MALPAETLRETARALHERGYISDEALRRVEVAAGAPPEKVDSFTVLWHLRDVLLEFGYLNPEVYEKIPSHHGRIAAIGGVLKGVADHTLRRVMVEGYEQDRAVEEAISARRKGRTAASRRA